ncbi:hypothetical protein OXX79_011366 [Metschnikowia pulcherrima]
MCLASCIGNYLKSPNRDIAAHQHPRPPLCLKVIIKSTNVNTSNSMLPSKNSILRVNLFFTRQFAYVAILFAAIVGVLLPVSVITYLSFYKMLVPVERVQTPTKFAEVGPSMRPSLSTSIYATDVLPFLCHNGNLTFSVRLNLDAICKYETAHQSLSYTFEMSPQHKISDWLLVNCDSRYIYVEKNNLVPYNLRYWVPPILVDVLKLVRVDHPLLYLKGHELHTALQTSNATFTLEKMNFLFLDSRKTFIDFVIEWDGLRYYLVNYYFTSLFIGAGCFWALSSVFCVLSAFVFSHRFLSDEIAEEKKSA